ncbi:hypothetical protein [Maribacter sp. Hel_I_7]|uniref:hypothetical protein n=1 Tax=Maribacter sp. Hel_I_7 TaxID=1249997 RepID=UPI00047A8E9E|nr:hypothetical protein [Maribacter sp. Hel_I_7]
MKSKIHEYQNKYLTMSKISKIIFAIAIGSMITVTSCRDTKTESTDDSGHEHNEDGSHMDDETIEQEEFQVGKDSMETKTETHKHDDGSEHHDH